MPLTKFQMQIAKLMAENRSEDSYLAGGAAIHFSPKSKRYSNDLDYFHDSVERVATAFNADNKVLTKSGYFVEIQMNQPGFIRAIVSKKSEATKVEWAYDSAWRFMPTVKNSEIGYVLDPIDLAVNKLLALAGRDEPRDFLDIIYIHSEVLSLGALVWAAVGKDPGFTPHSLLEIIKRRGKYRQQDFERLKLKQPVNLQSLKSTWLEAIAQAAEFINTRPTSEAGCLYYSQKTGGFLTPTVEDKEVVSHYASLGGIIPQFDPS